MNTFDVNREGKGTKEWSDFSYNICLGCQHGCLYCYAWSKRARFNKSMRKPGRWRAQAFNPNQAKLGADVGEHGVVMFPTSHDITPQFLPESIITIRNLLRCNDVLITTKPHLAVVKALCREFRANKDHLMFRFTIGSLDPTLTAFWEPGAPRPEERLQALAHAFKQGFRASISCEPMLAGAEEAIKLVRKVERWTTDSIWIGKMQRVPRKLNAHVAGFPEALKLVKAQQKDAEILGLVGALKHNPKIFWKDSVKAVIQRSAARREACQSHQPSHV